MNKLDAIPAQVSARQGHSSKERAEQGSEAADTGLAKGPGGSTCGICSPLVSSNFCPIAAPHRQVWVCIWVVYNRGHKSLPCRSSSAEIHGKRSMENVLFWLNFCKFGNVFANVPNRSRLSTRSSPVQSQCWVQHGQIGPGVWGR